jgi:hypothetical protein
MSSAIARAAIAPVLAEPRVRAEQVTQLLLGETAAVTDRSGDWHRVCTHIDGYDGWINAGYLRVVEDTAAGEWRLRAGALRVPCFVWVARISHCRCVRELFSTARRFPCRMAAAGA